jgi:hypothetical protein
MHLPTCAPCHGRGRGPVGRRHLVDDQTGPLEFLEAVVVDVANDVAIGLDQLGCQVPLGLVHHIGDDVLCFHDLPPTAL